MGPVWTVHGLLSLILPFNTDKADHISLLVRMINFSWLDGPVCGPSGQYGWLIVSTYQYVLVIFHVLMGPVRTVHGR